MAPRRCDRNTSELPQCGQCRLGSTFISNAPLLYKPWIHARRRSVIAIRAGNMLLANYLSRHTAFNTSGGACKALIMSLRSTQNSACPVGGEPSANASNDIRASRVGPLRSSSGLSLKTVHPLQTVLLKIIPYAYRQGEGTGTTGTCQT
jgi:hypothetical protein